MNNVIPKGFLMASAPQSQHGCLFSSLRHRPSAALLALAFFVAAPALRAQLTSEERSSAAGDTATTEVPLATGLSARLDKKDVAHAIRKVADWQLQRAQPSFNQDWTFAAMYAGFMAVPETVNGSTYRDAMLAMGSKFHWQPGPRLPHADDHAIGQTYLDLYARDRDPAMLAPIRERMDAVMKLPDDPAKPLWWWSDALFMAPPVLAKLSRATGDRKYLDFMDHEWWITSNLLYSPADHLYFRDKSYFTAHEANGAKVFWSRGNGWVFAGLARVLSEMPSDYPSRPKYVAQFREMAEKIASLQGADGLWTPGLLDAAS
jgi:rhamnogalacturonyl hydrolase YesR